MPKNSRSLYPDYKKIWIFGLGYTAAYGQFRKGLLQYRGRTKKWLIRDIGYPVGDPESIRKDVSECDLLVGRIHNLSDVDFFTSLGKPIIDLSEQTTHPLIHRSHTLDFRAGGAMAGSFLRHLGHKNFAFITYSQYPRGMVENEALAWEGFSDAVMSGASSLQLIQRKSRVRTILKPVESEKPLESVSAWFREMERPMALLLFEDWMAQEISQFAHFSGISIPEDLAVIGMQNDPLVCEMSFPSLSSIAFPGEYWGMRVAEHIDALLTDKSPGELEQIAPSQVVERNSTSLTVIDDPLVARGLALMRHYATSRLSIKEMLKELPVTMRAFQVRFRSVTGFSPLEELFRIRVELARQQLVESDYTVERIAEECGFRHSESMAQYFKKWTGLTPTQYRRQHRHSG